jgi:hypothetical protein
VVQAGAEAVVGAGGAVEAVGMEGDVEAGMEVDVEAGMEVEEGRSSGSLDALVSRFLLSAAKT